MPPPAALAASYECMRRSGTRARSKQGRKSDRAREDAPTYRLSVANVIAAAIVVLGVKEAVGVVAVVVLLVQAVV